jgi:hypothetical protein
MRQIFPLGSLYITLNGHYRKIYLKNCCIWQKPVVDLFAIINYLYIVLGSQIHVLLTLIL